MSHIKNVNIGFQNSAAIDGFGRLRVSNPYTIFESKQIFDNAPLFWEEDSSTGNTTSAHSTDKAATTLTSVLSTADTFTRQTYRRIHYQAGKCQYLFITGIIDVSGGGAGVQRRIGLFDDDNGLFFEDDAGTLKVARRSHASGGPLDVKVAQTSWNIDVMDGTGVSGLAADWTKSQIFFIDFEWLGMGRVRMGILINGIVCIVHEFLGANVLAEVYMSTPHLPFRAQMITTGASPVAVMQINCVTAMSEGGQDKRGLLRYASTNGVHIDANVEDTLYAIIGIRLKAAYTGAHVDIEKIGISIQTPSEAGEWILIFNPSVADTFTYAAETNSALEVARGQVLNIVTNGTYINGGYAVSLSGGGGGGASTFPVESELILGCTIAGVMDTIVLAWRPIGATASHDIEGSITWREVH